jgi:hypothetical protein
MRERGGAGDEDGANAPISLEERGDDSFVFGGGSSLLPRKRTTFL